MEARLARPFFPIDREAALSHCWLLHLVVSRCMYLLGQRNPDIEQLWLGDASVMYLGHVSPLSFVVAPLRQSRALLSSA